VIEEKGRRKNAVPLSGKAMIMMIISVIKLTILCDKVNKKVNDLPHVLSK
jgi:hypothetical protein